jgi:uncharacterized protein YjdB
MKKNNTIKLIIISVTLIILIIVITLIKTYTFSLEDTINFTSQVYKIEDNYIKNISPNTSKELYKDYFDLVNCNLKVVDENNQEITTDYIYTGSITQVYDNQNNLLYTYKNIITGDITDDGIVDKKDITKLSQYLIENNNLSTEEKKAIDLNNDQKIKINDLTLLEEYLNTSYQTITLNKEELILMTNETERLIPTLNPTIILNQNLTWTSSNNSVAKVSNTGLVEPLTEGETTITATTPDGKLQASTKIIVDNTIQLSNTSGTIYTGNNSIEVSIKSLDYENITCKVEQTQVATCNIKDNKLIISPINDGTTKVVVSSPKYGEAIYNATVVFTSLNVLPHSYCLLPNSGYGGGIISGFNFGTLSVKNISDKEIIWYASINRNGIRISTGSKTGDAEVIFIESNGQNTSTFTGHVYQLYLDSYQATSYINGEDIITKINASNTGDLSCASSNSEIATCKIEENNLIVTPLQVGETTITIKGSKCGETTYKINIQGSVDK